MQSPSLDPSHAAALRGHDLASPHDAERRHDVARPPDAERRYDIDVLRTGAFALLILYHVGMYYVAEWGWHVKSVHVAEWLQLPMTFVNRWRMLLLFVISGVAVHFLRRNLGLAAFVRARTMRLLLPLAFGMAVVVPVQPYAEMLAKGLIEPGYWAFQLRYWSGQGFAPDAYGGWEHGWTWNHLWYLPYLWSYTLALAVLLPWLESRTGRRLRERLAALRGWGLLLAPAVPLLAWALLLQRRFPETHALVDDWYNHAIYFTGFLYGYLLGAHAGLWAEFARLRVRSLVAALACFAAYLVVREHVDFDSPTLQLAPVFALRWAYTWLAIATLFGWAHAYLNRPYAWLPYASTAVYPWYVLHQSAIVAIGWFALRPLGLGPVLEPTLLIAGTVLACGLAHHFVVRRVRWLQPLFGVKPARATRASRSAGESTVVRAEG